jgi:hypothetical protein
MPDCLFGGGLTTALQDHGTIATNSSTHLGGGNQGRDIAQRKCEDDAPQKANNNDKYAFFVVRSDNVSIPNGGNCYNCPANKNGQK